MPSPAVLEPFSRKVRLPHSGVELFHYDSGEEGKPPLLLVHGLGDDADTWRRVWARLSERYRLVAPDLPGFGRSPGMKCPSPPRLCAVLVELMDVLGIGKAGLVGNSLGATLAQFIAIGHPERVARLVAVDGSLTPLPSVSPDILGMLLPFVGKARFHRLAQSPDAAYASLGDYYEDLDALPKSDRDFLYRRVNDRVSSPTQRRAYFSVIRHDILWMGLNSRRFAASVAGIVVPTLYVWGEADLVMPLSIGQAVAKLQAGSRLVIIAGSGHLPHQERPEEFVDALL
jgi:pimeloyl-ACP methyl ester carboxylesterase